MESAAAILAESAPQVQWDHTAAAAHVLQDLNLRARTDLVAQALQDDIGSVPGAGYPTAAGSFRATLAVQRPEANLPILGSPYRDPSEYVRRSVANHLNDLARHAPSAVVATAREWLSAADANTGRVVRHGLRTLVKKGHPGALALLAWTTSSTTARRTAASRPRFSRPQPSPLHPVRAGACPNAMPSGR
ncbi:hypothetical protein [Arthrobacter sp. PGP41]|uniref:hypothetical protein n=1 Tax=Arthrobacter sp. PGP41 TaxID=2079227 RepID=UPI001F18C30E|nr:hypothetical protein [Arthrobacter sp. PGP41]